ncbi:MAG: phosphate ABC transporter permease PstA [Deltaproteobacteria bacterium]|nr:phosphate ABC transporter permease PstA [Deltaproteobacteria bacterium]
MSRRKLLEQAVFLLFRGAAVVNGIALAVILFFLVKNGWRAISWSFLTQVPTDSMTKGGIWPCIIGTVYLSFGALLIAFPLGIGSAVYLNEYAGKSFAVRAIRFAVNNLAGVPSVVFGLFGLAVFVTLMGLGVSLVSGALTLGLLSLPMIIGTAEEALKAVPDTYREASLGLGGTQWQTIYRVVIPAAFPSIITGCILALSRAAGETAAIMFTGAVFYTRQTPHSILDPVMALPYHIYVLATAGTDIDATRPLQYGTALVLIALVMGMNLFAVLYRSRLRKKRA